MSPVSPGPGPWNASPGSALRTAAFLMVAVALADAKAPATVATGASVRNVVVHPSGRYAYATAMGAGGPGGDLIGQYLVSPVDGTLILNTPTSVGANPDPGPMACTPNGEFLLVGTSASGTASIDVYTINTDPDNLVNDGTISGPVSTAAVPDVAQWISVSADGAEVYVASNTAGTIQAFTLSAAGVLAPLDGETIGATVRGIGVKSAADYRAFSQQREVSLRVTPQLSREQKGLALTVSW